MRQPDECLCFGGRCWKKFCPNKQKPFEEKQGYERPQGKSRKRRSQVLTLRESLKNRSTSK